MNDPEPPLQAQQVPGRHPLQAQVPGLPPLNAQVQAAPPLQAQVHGPRFRSHLAEYWWRCLNNTTPFLNIVDLIRETYPQ